jgi:hypothetical protein
MKKRGQHQQAIKRHYGGELRASELLAAARSIANTSAMKITRKTGGSRTVIVNLARQHA